MSFLSDLRAALALPNRGDAAERTHEVVAQTLHRLDPTVDIKRTDYFTHSFVPDLVVTWGAAEYRRERHVHLRFSVLSPSFEQDLDLLGSESPLFLGMTDTADLSERAWAANTGANGSLVTQSPAVAELHEVAQNEVRTRKATSPLVRVGHGLLDEVAAQEISQSYVEALKALETIEDVSAAQISVASALKVLDPFLPEAGDLDVERALQSEWIRHGADPFDFPSSTPWNPELLDTASLREVLTSLLDSDQPVAPETWQRNAGFIRAEDIGRVLGRNIRGGKFNEMAHALLSNWTAKWVWAERASSPPLFDTYDWLINDGILGLEVSDLSTFFADDGRHFKDKEGGRPLPSLVSAQQMLSQPGVVQVGLRGAMEGLRYESLRTTSSVYERIKEILSAPDAAGYGVQFVKAIVPGTDWSADIDLDRQIIDLEGQSTPVSSLARLAARFFSRSISTQALDHFLATGEPPEAAQSVA